MFCISVTQIDEAFPARPNGLFIRYIEVDGGALDSPYLSEYPAGYEEIGSGIMDDGAGYVMVVSRFEVRYTVPNCGAGMDLLVGRYDNAEAHVKVERVSRE